MEAIQTDAELDCAYQHSVPSAFVDRKNKVCLLHPSIQDNNNDAAFDIIRNNNWRFAQPEESNSFWALSV